jgi:hypothetical protein
LRIASLGVEFGVAETGHDRIRLDPGIHARAGIPFFLRIVKMPMITARREQLGRHVGRLRLEFLHAHDIGILLCHPFEKTFFGRRADPVQIGGNDL